MEGICCLLVYISFAYKFARSNAQHVATFPRRDIPPSVRVCHVGAAATAFHRRDAAFTHIGSGAVCNVDANKGLVSVLHLREHTIPHMPDLCTLALKLVVLPIKSNHLLRSLPLQANVYVLCLALSFGMAFAAPLSLG